MRRKSIFAVRGFRSDNFLPDNFRLSKNTSCYASSLRSRSHCRDQRIPLDHGRGRLRGIFRESVRRLTEAGSRRSLIRLRCETLRGLKRRGGRAFIIKMPKYAARLSVRARTPRIYINPADLALRGGEKPCAQRENAHRPRAAPLTYVRAVTRAEMGKHRIFMRHGRNIISELRLNYFRAARARPRRLRRVALNG